MVVFTRKKKKGAHAIRQTLRQACMQNRMHVSKHSIKAVGEDMKSCGCFRSCMLKKVDTPHEKTPTQVRG
jgi:hypothetical protein